MMTFEDLNLSKPLLNALTDLEYVNPTPIQKVAFSPIMSGKDIVGIAQTGTGKTFAYLLPLLRLWKFSQDLHPRIVILVPTRELVVQIVSEIEKLTKYMSINTYGVYGGININTQKSIIFQGIDIVVGTPGRLMDLAMSGALKLKMVKHFIIDEVDEMLELGFRTQLNNVLDMMPVRRQNLLFSATLSNEVEQVVNTFFNRAQKIEIAKTGTPLDQIEQFAYLVPNFNSKINLLTHLLQEEVEMSKVLVFVRYKRWADMLFDHLSLLFEDQVGVIHSNKSQNHRINAVSNFDKGAIRLLIATDVIARGVDINEVSHVLNFDLSEVPEIYIHRIGRTGRADKKGISISFINEMETLYQIQIEELMNKKITMIETPDHIISTDLLTEEKEVLVGDKHYRKEHTIKHSQGAFQEKSTKNSKINLGGPSKRKPAKTKPVNRSGQKRKAKNRKRN